MCDISIYQDWEAANYYKIRRRLICLNVIGRIKICDDIQG